MHRPARTVLTAGVLMVALASPAAAQMLTTGHVEGTVVSVNTVTNRITLTDGTGVRYRPGDTFATTHIHEQPGGDPFDCDITDHGEIDHGTIEAQLERLLVPGGQLVADVQKHRRDGASFFYVTVDTCDGVLDGRDA